MLPHVRTGIDRAADWLADAGYEVVDAEPPLIAEATAAWIDAIWAEVGILWPLKDGPGAARAAAWPP